jgi:hypothetical protein
MKKSLLLLSILMLIPGYLFAFSQNQILASLPDNSAKDLGGYAAQCADSSFDPDNCRRVADYSRFTYDPERHQIYFFGGGHSTTMRDDIDVFNFTTLTWKSDYASTKCSDMTSITDDGTWSSSGHPVARHTYDQLIYAPNVHGLMITSPVYGAGYCGTFGGCGQWCAGKMLLYNPDTKSWTVKTSSTNPPHGVSSEYDPVSGRIISAGGPGLLTYDPVTDIKTEPLSSSSIGDYACNLVYFPPNDKFYYFERGNPIKVFAVALNRTTWSSSTILEVTGMTGTPGTGETGWAYDSANHIIGGGVTGGEFYAFDPLTKAWDTKAMTVQGAGTAPTCNFHALEYDPVDKVFIIYGEDFHTWGYCYKRTGASVASTKAGISESLFSVALNPIQGSLVIYLTKEISGGLWSLKVMDSQGRLINDLSDKIANGRLEWNPAGYSGMCILTVSNGKNYFSRQVVVIK